MNEHNSLEILIAVFLLLIAGSLIYMFKAMSKKVSQFLVKSDHLGDKIDGVASKTDHIEKEITTIRHRLDTVEDRMDKIEKS